MTARIMNPIEQYQFWVGLGFAAVFVAFLMIAFFKAKNLTDGQRLMLRIMSAVCGAIAGVLISGEALLNFSRQVPGGKLTVSGTAGFAVFFAIWFFFPKGPAAPPPAEGFNFSVKKGWRFSDTAETLARSLKTTVDYDGFSNQELAAPLKAWELECKTPQEALERLGSIVEVPNAIRKYKAIYKNSVYVLKIK
jgi:hypothetical protein